MKVGQEVEGPEGLESLEKSPRTGGVRRCPLGLPAPSGPVGVTASLQCAQGTAFPHSPPPFSDLPPFTPP